MTTVNDIVNATNADIVSLTDEAREFINTLRGLLDTDYNLKIPGGRTFNMYSGGGMYEALQSKPTRPEGMEFQTQESVGSVPTYTVRDAVLVDVPDFAETPPLIVIPETPTMTLPSEPGAPSVNDVVVPGAIEVVLPTLPTLVNVEVPSAPTLTLPTFDATFPETPDLLLRTDEFSYVEVEYDSALLDALELKLLSDVRDGGYGIEVIDEDAMWGRARDREYQAAMTEEAEIEARYAGRGYPLIPGVAVEAIMRVARATHDKLSDFNREMTITRAELFRKTREMAIEKSITLESMLNQMHGFARERALNAARITAEFAVTVFDALVRKHNAIIAAHQAQISAYSEQIQAIRVQTDIYRTQVEAALAKHQSNEQAVRLYTAQLSAVGTLVDLHRSQLEAARITSDIERTKLDMFRSKIEAFVAQVGARTAQVDLYRTAVQGELVKAQVYGQQVSAYESRVRAAEANSRLQNLNVATDIEKARLSLATYDTRISKYRADLAGETERVRALASIYGADSDVYRALLAGWEALFGLSEKSQETFLRTIQEDTRLEQSAAQLHLAELTSETEIRFKAAATGAELYRELLAAKAGVASAIAITED